MESYKEVYDSETLEKLDHDFQRLGGVAYLDHTGAAPYPEGLVEAVGAELRCRLLGNPHALNTSSRLSSDLVEQTRERILAMLGVKSNEYHLVFTSGATAALATIAQTFTWSSEDSFVYLEESHTSVLGIREEAYHHSAKVVPISKLELEKIFNEGGQLPGQGGLFAYPGQCNFSGSKYPLTWVDAARAQGDWTVLVDTASLAASSPLDLSKNRPDFVCLSFYKMFGLPTGLGALLVRVEAAKRLEKRYFGGGTVLMALASGKRRHEPRNIFHERFEDGTLNFLAIVQLRVAIDYFQKLIPGGIIAVEEHSFNLAQYLFRSLAILKHFNGEPLAVFYHDTKFESKHTQGPIVNFNLKRADGSFIGFSEVMHMCNLFDVHLRTGCFCNPGACQRHLGLTLQELEQHFEAGHVCGDSIDLLGGRPTGSVRASVGYCSQKKDVNRLLEVVKRCFLETAPKEVQHRAPQIAEGAPLRLQRLFLYPVKSGGAQEVQCWPLASTGLLGDRCWMVATDAGTPVTQKTHPRLCRLAPALQLDTNKLKLSFPEMPDIEVEFLREAPGTTELATLSKVCGARVTTRDCGDEVADWLSKALETSGLRLLQQWTNDQRQQKNGSANLSLANQSQFLLIGESSLRWLENEVREKLSAEEEEFQCKDENLLLRFRANMIISGSKPFEEKEWKVLRIGNSSFTNDGPCTRCQMVCINQLTGEKTVEPLRTIAAAGQGKMQFGVYFSQIVRPVAKVLFVGSPVLPLDL